MNLGEDHWPEDEASMVADAFRDLQRDWPDDGPEEHRRRLFKDVTWALHVFVKVADEDGPAYQLRFLTSLKERLPEMAIPDSPAAFLSPESAAA